MNLSFRTFCLLALLTAFTLTAASSCRSRGPNGTVKKLNKMG